MATSTHLISQDDAPLFRENFNRRDFLFHHRLADHPLFEMPRLCRLADTLARNNSFYFNAGDVAVHQRYDESDHGRLTLEEAMRRIENSSAWIVLKRVDRDPEYRDLLAQCMAEIERFSGLKFDGLIRDVKASIVVTSPGRTTLYHMDADCNYLFQIRGEKELRVFSRDDREVLPETEIEAYRSGDHSGARYKPQFESRAHIYAFAPGQAVHIPVHAPHWVQNGNSISISLSINFELLAEDRAAAVYRFNRLLRRAGLHPRPPGLSPLRDTAKRTALKALQAATSLRGKLRKPDQR